MKESKSTLISAIFLVAGTSIGGGMLALPVATGVSGFVPSMSMMAICWLAMTLSALLYVEVSLWLEEGAHVITMTSRLLGPIGKAISWLLYLYICYATLTAYAAGGGLQIQSMLNSTFHLDIAKDLCTTVFTLLFVGLIYLGSRILGRVNSILFLAMVGAYVAIVGMGVDEVQPHLLAHQNWKMSLLAIPLLLTTFSFQTMVPSLTPYLKRNAKHLRIAIIGGTFITFMIYAAWQCLILGIVPVEGTSGLAEALAKGEPPTQFLWEHVDGYWIGIVAEFFAFFAIITSFLGIGLGLFDFLSDGLKIKQEGWGKIALGLLVVIPVVLFATQFERVFLVALDSTGGFGDTILNGMIPVLMVWIGRYKMGLNGEKLVGGGKFVLVLIFTFFLGCFFMELLAYTGITTSFYDAYDIMELPDPQRALSD